MKISILSLLFATAALGSAHADLSISGQELTVSTANALLSFVGPDLVGFRNTLVDETYLTNAPASPLSSLNTYARTGAMVSSAQWTAAADAFGHAAANIVWSDSRGTLTETVSIDPTTNEVIVVVTGSAAEPGLRRAEWNVAGLDLAHNRLIIPANSGLVFDRDHPGVGANLDYLNTWHAQMLVVEGSRGSAVLYANDLKGNNKHVGIQTRGQSTIDLSLSSVPTGLWSVATTVPLIEWRIKATAGDWKEAAMVYRNWMAANRPRPADGSREWARSIRAVVRVSSLDPSLLDVLATRLTPSRTLLYLFDWRVSPYDVNYPDYTPRSGVKTFIDRAHALGFRVMIHSDLIGVSPSNPDYASVASVQVKDAQTGALEGWLWNDISNPGRFAIISPASATYRSLFVTRVTAAIAALRPEALHLDFSGQLPPDGNGLIDGKTYGQGCMALHEELQRAFPNLVLAGEGTNDMISAYNWFAQEWHVDLGFKWQAHPICSFLFGPQLIYYGHLGQPKVTDPSFKRTLAIYERQAVIPSLGVDGPADLDLSQPDIARVIRLLGAWQNEQFSLAGVGDWNGAAVRYVGASSSAELRDDGHTVELSSRDMSFYRRVHDSNTLVSPLYSPGWPGYDATTLYGLNPGNQYWLDDRPPAGSTHITSLPDGYQLGSNTTVSSEWALFEIDRVAKQRFDPVESLFGASVGITVRGTDQPLHGGAVVYPQIVMVGGMARPSLFMHPPYMSDVGGETFAEYPVLAPSGATLRYSIGIQDGAAGCTDGVTFRVLIDGNEFARQSVQPGQWIDASIDIAPRAMARSLRLSVNPGPNQNASCDWAAWSNFDLSSKASAMPINLSLVLSQAAWTFQGDGSFSQTGSSATVKDLTVPAKFVLFAGAKPVSAGTHLAAVAFETRLGGDDDLPVPGTVFGAGEVVASTAGGITKPQTINGHPPNSGRTVLSWALSLPSDTPLVLAWSAAIADGAFSLTGVEFSVRVNGDIYWTRDLLTPGWIGGELKLTRWKGKKILLELVTDSIGDNTYDWARWGDLLLTADQSPSGKRRAVTH